MTTGLGTDFAWIDGDVTDDLAIEDDEGAAYTQSIVRSLTTAGLWYAPTWGRDVRGYLLDVATDSQIEIEVSGVVERDERTARCEVRVTRAGSTVAGAIAAYTKRGAVHRFTLAIDAVTGDVLFQVAA